MRFFILITILLSLAAAEDNKTKIFLDKYLPASKTEKYRPETPNYSIKGVTGQIETNMTKFDQETGMRERINGNKNAEMTGVAEGIRNMVDSKEFKDELKKNENYILYDSKLMPKGTDAAVQSVIQKIRNSNRLLGEDEAIYVVISSSMPKHLIQEYIKVLEDVNTEVNFILQGVIGSVKEFKPTINFVNDVRTFDGKTWKANIIINPKVVNYFNIEKVPAVIFAKNYNGMLERKSSMTQEECDYWVVYGSVGVRYALEKINKEANSEGINKILKKIGRPL